MALDCFSLRNPNPILRFRTPPLPPSSSTASQFSLRLDFSRRIHSPALSAAYFSYIPRGICGSALLPPRNRRSFLQLATPRDDSERSEIGEESDEAWGQALAVFKEQALKLTSVSQEAYEIYSKKTIVVLKETSRKLKIEAAKASYDLSIIAQDVAEEGSQYVAQAAANSPQPLKDVVETFASTEKFQHVSQLQDFYVGVPYGAILSLGGFLNFMITGSTSAIRFGVILGGILLALSVSSLRSWRKGKAADGMVLQCETAIAGILFLRHLCLFFQKRSFPGLISTTVSGWATAFFIYRLIMFREDANETNIDREPQT